MPPSDLAERESAPTESKQNSRRGGSAYITDIGNKQKRSDKYSQAKSEAKRAHSKARKKRKREAELLGDDAPPKQVARTLDNTREADDTIVEADDEEIEADQQVDEFASYFSGATPKIMITTNKAPSVHLHTFIADLMAVFPNSAYYKRGTFELKKICAMASERGFTDMMVINENKKTANGVVLIHLPGGPTAHFKLSSIVLAKDVFNHARPSDHKPELILNNFTTRLGHRIARFFTSLLPQVPQFEGRRVVTFHNQRDFVFFRHHRYIFEGDKRARIQEIGPRFTLKLKSLQLGTFDTKFGEYEWMHTQKMDTSRRRYFL